MKPEEIYKQVTLLSEVKKNLNEEIKILNKDKVSTFSEIYKIDEEIEKRNIPMDFGD